MAGQASQTALASACAAPVRVWGRAAWRAWCVVVAAGLQLGFLAEFFLPGELDPARSQISELSAPGQPGALWFRAADVATGLLVLVVVPGWWRASRPVGTCLATWGSGLAVAALFSASCANSLDPGCDGSGLPGPGTSLRNNLHDVGSILSVLTLLLGIVLAGEVLRRRARRRGGSARRGWLVLGLGLASCALGLFESAEDVVGATSGRGVSQRLQVLLLSVALVLLADPRRWPRAGARRLVTPAERTPSGR